METLLNMETLWFCLIALMIAAYVVFDGFDIGAGIVHLLIARTEEERKSVLGSIGPVWDGNEVWLLAAGGTLFFAFPALYASSFSGFYLPLMMVLWLLILRGVSIEFRSHIDSNVWKPLLDFGFAASSALLAIFFGAALGNVVRGVPLDASGNFFLALWTDFTPGKDAGVLDWYTVLIGIAAFLALTMHGALWVELKTSGDLESRSRQLARNVWWGVLAITGIVTFASFQIQPHIAERFGDRPWGYVFPGLAAAGLMAVRWSRHAFMASCLYIVGMLCSAAFGLFPFMLPSNGDRSLGLTVYNSAASDYGLRVGLVWWTPGVLLVVGYFIYTYRHFGAKTGAVEVGEK
jgi:cytochrome bd ubiquinol oxidase subunit II